MPTIDNDIPDIERMWAWHIMQRLLDDADRNGDRTRVIDEIVRLGEGYSIVSEYTSFLVLENDQEYKRWKIERRNVLRINRDRTSQKRFREELAKLRKSSAANVRPVERKKAEPQKSVSNRITPATKQAPQVARRSPGRNRNRSFDIGLPSGGGGAIDPLSALIALTILGCAGTLKLRRHR